MDPLDQIAKLLKLPAGPYTWGHGYYSVVGEELQQPRWRLETPKGYQFFAPTHKVARKGDLVVRTLQDLDACDDTDAEAQRRVLDFLEKSALPKPSPEDRKVAEVVRQTGVTSLDAQHALEQCGFSVEGAVDYARRKLVRMR